MQMYRSSSSISLAPLGCSGLAQGLPQGRLATSAHEEFNNSAAWGCRVVWALPRDGNPSCLLAQLPLEVEWRSLAWATKASPALTNIWAAHQERSPCHQSHAVHGESWAAWSQPRTSTWDTMIATFKKPDIWNTDLIQSSAAMHIWCAVQTKEKKALLTVSEELKELTHS